MFDIKENLKKLPDKPGVYMHRDKLGNIIYVGKAINLKNRVRQYFQSSKTMAPKVRSMVSQIAEFEYITVASEMEALILECNLIKKHRPKYNILLRDDKTYPYIKITNEDYPRVIKTRMMKKDGGKYFGPYSDVGAVNRIVELLNGSFELKKCSTSAFPPGFRPCLNFHINQCKGICTGDVKREEYAESVKGALEFLNGHTQPMMNRLKSKMMAASEKMEYEEAAMYRDYMEAAKALSETQRVVLHHDDEADIVLPCIVRGSDGNDFADEIYMVIFNVREGKLVGRESYALEAEFSVDDDAASMVSAFIPQHYGNMPHIPKEILVAHMPEDAESLEGFLTEQANHNVKIIKPERGEKRALVQLASRDVLEMNNTISERAAAARERRETLGREIWNVLQHMRSVSGAYDGREFRAEAYDISNTNGVDTVGAMVVFNGLKADRRSYRKFKVRTVTGQDDYGSMKEVLSRRFLRVFKGDEKFSVLPDIIFMDGGKGHVTTALEVIDETGFDIPVVGMVKDDHHRTRGLIYRKPAVNLTSANSYGKDDWQWEELSLSSMPLLYKYIGTMQEEVHRFAIEYHHKVRGKNAQKSLLDEIEGIGPVRRKALLEAFGSVDAIRRIVLGESQNDGKSEGQPAGEEHVPAGLKSSRETAGLKDRRTPAEILADVPGMDLRAAKSICDFFNQSKTLAK